MGLIWSLIVGAIIGVIAGAITGRGNSMGWHGIDTIDHRGNYFSSDCFISFWSNQ